MAYKVINRVPLMNEQRPTQVKETTITIQEKSPFTQFTRTLDGDWRSETENSVIDAVLEQVYKDTFSGRFESEKVTSLENEVLKVKDNQAQATNKVNKLEQNLIKEMEKVTQLVETIIHAEDLTAAQKELILAKYPVYEIGQRYDSGDVVNYDSELYEVIQGHVAQGDWKPSETPALYKSVNNTVVEDEQGNEIEIINDFIPPTGAHDAYETGDKVRFNGEVYESIIDANVYSPDDYPQGWKLIENEE